jgi:hypothetical protein
VTPCGSVEVHDVSEKRALHHLQNRRYVNQAARKSPKAIRLLLTHRDVYI